MLVNLALELQSGLPHSVTSLYDEVKTTINNQLTKDQHNSSASSFTEQQHVWNKTEAAPIGHNDDTIIISRSGLNQTQAVAPSINVVPAHQSAPSKAPIPGIINLTTNFLAWFAIIVPGGLCKLMFPHFLIEIPTNLRVFLVFIFYFVGLALLANSSYGIGMTYLGTCILSIAVGVVDITSLALTPSHGKVSMISYGTGSAIAGFLSYLIWPLVSNQLSFQLCSYITMAVPIIILFCYLFVIKPDKHIAEEYEEAEMESRYELEQNRHLPSENTSLLLRNEDDNLSHEDDVGRVSAFMREAKKKLRSAHGNMKTHFNTVVEKSRTREVFDTDLTIKERIECSKCAWKYFTPIFITYVMLFFMERGLFANIELVTDVDKRIVTIAIPSLYALGEVFGRASLELFRFKHVWILTILQIINAILMLLHCLEVIYLPGLTFICFFMVYIGLICGVTFTNSYNNVLHDIDYPFQSTIVSVVNCEDVLACFVGVAIGLPVSNKLVMMRAANRF